MSTLILPSSLFTSDTWLWGRGGPLCCSEASPRNSFSFLFVLCVIFVCSEKQVCLMNNMCLKEKKTLFFLHLRQILSWTALHVIMVMLCKGKQVQSFCRKQLIPASNVNLIGLTMFSEHHPKS